MAFSITTRAARRIPGLLNLSSATSIPRNLSCRAAPRLQVGITQNILLNSRRWASSVTPQSSASDPAEADALRCLEQGTAKLEEGDVLGAKSLYQRSCEIKRNASSLFNLGVTHYHLKEYDDAISAWKESITLQPSSPDAHTNLASAYIISPVSRPDLALHHLEIASSLSPEDPEIAFNHAAVLEATGRLGEALDKYKLSEQFGVARAAIHIRNISAKILAQRLKGAQNPQKSGE